MISEAEERTTRNLRKLVNPEWTTFASGIQAAVGLSVDYSGRMLYIRRTWASSEPKGEVWAIYGSETPILQLTVQPESVVVARKSDATFTVEATGVTSITYQWMKNGVDIAGATSNSYTEFTVLPADDGDEFTCRVTGGGQTVASQPAFLTIDFTDPPKIKFRSPRKGRKYTGGGALGFKATAKDITGQLPASNFEWEILFWHIGATKHSHPFFPPTTGIKRGRVVIPRDIEQSTSVWLEVRLTVTGSTGLKTTKYRSVKPTKVWVKLAYENRGKRKMPFWLDGGKVIVHKKRGYKFRCVAGNIRAIEANSWKFGNWSDGGEKLHDIVCPMEDATVTAWYEEG